MTTTRERGARMREFTATLVDKRPVMGDSWLMTLSAPSAIVASARAGHFVNVLPHEHGTYDPLLRRPFSIYSTSPERDEMTLLVRPYGRGAGWIVDRTVGAGFNILGLLGNTFEIQPRSTHLLMVGGGVGAAPLLMLSEQAIADGKEVTYLLGAMTSDALLDASEFPSQVEYVVATEDGTAGHKGYVTDLVPDYLQWADQVFACGPTPMFLSLRNQVIRHRIGKSPVVQVSVERTMACGVGACLGCMVETRHGMKTSCVDGPVFDMEKLTW